jgi:hypothetical protein
MMQTVPVVQHIPSWLGSIPLINRHTKQLIDWNVNSFINLVFVFVLVFVTHIISFRVRVLSVTPVEYYLTIIIIDHSIVPTLTYLVKWGFFFTPDLLSVILCKPLDTLIWAGIVGEIIPLGHFTLADCFIGYFAIPPQVVALFVDLDIEALEYFDIA